MIESIILGLAIFFSAFSTIAIIHENNEKAQAKVDFITLIISCILWTTFYYLTKT